MADMEEFEQDSMREKCHIFRVKEVSMVADGVRFPLREARMEARRKRLEGNAEDGLLDSLEGVEARGADDEIEMPPPMQALEDGEEESDVDEEEGDEPPSSSTDLMRVPRGKRIYIPRIGPAPRPHIPDLRDELSIKFTQENPKRPGSQSYELYERYKSATTIQQARVLGASKGHIRYDLKKGFAQLDSSPSVIVMGCVASKAPLLEGWCSSRSPLGEVGEICRRRAIRLTSEDDLAKAETIRRAKTEARCNPGSRLRASLPCTPWASWQRVNLAKGDAEFREELQRSR